MLENSTLNFDTVSYTLQDQTPATQVNKIQNAFRQREHHLSVSDLDSRWPPDCKLYRFPCRSENIFINSRTSGTSNVADLRQIDWDAVSAALNLNKGAVTKRWSRLKTAMEKQQTPSSSSYPFLWLCVKHNTHTNVRYASSLHISSIPQVKEHHSQRYSLSIGTSSLQPATLRLAQHPSAILV